VSTTKATQKSQSKDQRRKTPLTSCSQAVVVGRQDQGFIFLPSKDKSWNNGSHFLTSVGTHGKRDSIFYDHAWILQRSLRRSYVVTWVIFTL
jgi:hypothetical protein